MDVAGCRVEDYSQKNREINRKIRKATTSDKGPGQGERETKPKPAQAGKPLKDTDPRK